MAQPVAINGSPGAFGAVPMADGNGCCGCGGPAPCYDGTCPTMTPTISENGAYPEQDGTYPPMDSIGISGWETGQNTVGDSDLSGYYMLFTITCATIAGVNYWVLTFSEEQVYYVGLDPVVIGPCIWSLNIPRPTVDGVIQKCPPSGTYVLPPPAGGCAVPPVPGTIIGPVTVTF
jgi:hypothetical protein